MAEGTDESRRPSGGFLFRAAVLLLTGVLIQAWLSARSGIGGDQFVLFDLGLDYLEEGALSAVGKGMSGGGFIPGSLLQLLIGLPFSIWLDYRSPLVLVGFFHLAAGILSLVVLRQAAGERAALIYLVLWWLSPWRLYHSGILWEPVYVILPAALHLWSCWSLRERAGVLASAVLAATLATAFQLHGSFLILVILTVILMVRRLIRIRWEGALLGAAAGSLTLLPTAAAFLEGRLPSPAPADSFLGYGLVTGVPLLRGFLYWFRLGSLDVGGRLTKVIFFDGEWVAREPLGQAVRGGAGLVVVLALASILLAVAATWWYFRRGGRVEGKSGGWRWLRGYCLCAFAGLMASCAFSPVTIQSWHVLIALPAACLPVAMWIDDLWRPRRRWLAGALVLFLALRLPEILLIGLGCEAYRVDPHIADRLQPRQQELLPEDLRQGLVP
jgi:hypothetical protein